MQIPAGTKIIIKGGSFSGALPSTCEISGSTTLNGTGTGASLTFQTGATLAAGSSLSMTGGALTIADGTIAGSLTCSNTTLNISALVVSGAFSHTGSTSATIASLEVSGSLTVGSSTTATSLTLASGASLTFANNATLVATAVSLSGTQTLYGAGRLQLPAGTNLSGLTQGADASVVVFCVSGNLTSFNAFARTSGSVGFKWTSSAANPSFLIEKLNASGEWVVVTTSPSSSTTDAATTATTYRAWDGVQYFVNEADPTSLRAVWRCSSTILSTNGGAGTGTGNAWTTSAWVIAQDCDDEE